MGRWNAAKLDQAKTAICTDGSFDDADAWVEAIAPRGGRTLDVGAGCGRIIKAIAPHCSSIIGVDSSPDMVRHAREYVGEDYVILADARGLPFPDDSFDFVYSVLCLQHLETKEDVQKALQEIVRVLKPSGTARLQLSIEPKTGQYRPANADEVADMLFNTGMKSAGFEHGLINKHFVWVEVLK